MINSAIKIAKLASKTVTVVMAAKTGYDIYKQGEKVYKGYKKIKSISDKAQKTVSKFKK
jgi:hypothetical protein